MFRDDRTQQELDTIGRFTQIGLVILGVAFLILTRFLDNSYYIHTLVEFFQGNFQRVNLDPLSSIQTVILFTITLLFTVTVFCKLFIDLKQVALDRSDDIHDNFNQGPISFYISILLENLVARWLFIDVLGNWFQANPLGIILLWFVGNLIWAAVHLFLYQKGKRNPRYLLPVFLAGIVLGYIYIKYGFWITVLVHLSYDIFVNAQFKKQQLNRQTLATGFYWLLVLILALLMANGQHIDFSFIPNILSGEIVAPNAMTMFVTVLAFSAITDVLGNLLAMDHLSINKDYYQANIPTLLFLYVVNVFLTIGIIYLISLAANAIFNSQLVSLFVVTGAYFVLISPKSGSAMAKTMVFSLAGSFLLAVAVMSFPYLTTVLIFLVASLFDIPSLIIGRNFAD